MGEGTMRRPLGTCALGGALALISTSSAQAANTYYKMSGAGPQSCALGDECSLAHAISIAVSGDTIVMEPGGGTYNPGSIMVPAGVTIGGQSGAPPPPHPGHRA